MKINNMNFLPYENFPNYDTCIHTMQYYCISISIVRVVYAPNWQPYMYMYSVDENNL